MRAATRFRASAAVALALASVVATAQPASATVELWRAWFERLMGGLKVTTRQISATGEQTQQVAKNALQANVSTQISQQMAYRALAIKNAYAYESGQGQTACAVAGSRAGLSSADAYQVAMRQAVREGDAAWLQSGGDAASRMNTSLQKRVGHYCTAEEASVLGSTYCRSSGSNARDAADSSAAPFLVNRDFGGEEVMNAAAYIDVLAPLPTVKATVATASDSAGLIDARLKGAAASAARAAMMDVAVSGMGGNQPSQ